MFPKIAKRAWAVGKWDKGLHQFLPMAVLSAPVQFQIDWASHQGKQYWTSIINIIVTVLCNYFSRWKGQTSHSLTPEILLSEEPDFQEAVTTSFPVTLCLSTLISQVGKHVQVQAEVCVCNRKWTARLSALLYTSCACEYVCTCKHTYLFVGMFCYCSVIPLQSLVF